MMFIDFLKAREGKNKYGMLPQNFNRRKNVAMEHNVQSIGEGRGYKHFRSAFAESKIENKKFNLLIQPFSCQCYVMRSAWLG